MVLKLKGDCNVELLLNNGKTTIVHVNRLKPYKTPKNMGQNFSKQERDLGVESSQTSSESGQTKPPQVKKRAKIKTDEDDDSTEDEFMDDPPPAAEQEVQKTTMSPRVTRSRAKQQGLVYNPETLGLEQDILDETIEALRRKNRKRIIHRKILDQSEFILVEDVYYQVKPTTYDLYDPAQSEVSGANRPGPSSTETTEPDIPDPEQSDSEDETEQQATPDFLLRHMQTEDTTVPRKVIFDPKVEEHKFQITPSPKAKTSTKSFAKEVLKGAAKSLLPSAFLKLADSPVRPIKGTHKSYAELLDELYPEEVKIEIAVNMRIVLI
jgi:hypothetical protein